MQTLDQILKLNPKSSNTLVAVNSFVSELVPIFHSDPYRIKETDTVKSLYDKFRKKELGGWCSLAAEYLVELLREMGISAYIYDYGFKGTEFTHMVVVAEGYLIDPYFSKHYVDSKGNLLKFNDLIGMLKNQDFSFSVVYGGNLKTKRIDDEKGHKFITIKPKDWETSLLNGWCEKGLDEILEAEFSVKNPHLLMLKEVKAFHPYPLIPELSSITKVETLADVLKLQEFVFTTIPYTEKPLEEIGSFTLTYRRFKKKEVGGWCGLNAEYLRRLLVCYGVKVTPYNYGLRSSRFTHVCLIVTFDGMEFLIDPYFNKIYTYKGDFPLQFSDLLRLIRDDKTNVIVPQYGKGQKPVWQEAEKDFVMQSGEQFEKSVFNFFYSIGLKQSLLDIFGYKNPLSLLLIKI